MINASLQKAIDNLQIEDVYVRDIIANCAEDFNPKYDPDTHSLDVETMHVVRRSMVLDLEDTKVLLIFVRLGTRWVKSNTADTEKVVRATIEAEYIAEYQMKADLDEECIEQFCLQNVSYHVWPYWRELLNSECVRLHLPRLILPTMQIAQNRHRAEEA